MRKLTLLYIVFVLLFTRCSDKHYPNLVYDGKSVIKLTVKNFQDTSILQYKVTTMLPNRCITNRVQINRNGDYYFSYKSSMPYLIQFDLIKNFQTYLLPDDTLSIIADMDSLIDKDKSISIKGIYGNISEYYEVRKKSVGYWDIRYPMAETSRAQTLEKSFAKSDSICSSEKMFLSVYKNSHSLPNWFCSIVETDIDYYRIVHRVSTIEFRRYMLKEQINNPENYFHFNEMPVYNPKAKLSKYYYDYLDMYFGIKHEEDLIGKSGLDRMLPLFTRSIPEAKSELKNDILEYYIASRLSGLFLSCRQKDELTKVDSVFAQTKSIISDKTLISTLESERENIAKFIETATTNNPFQNSGILIPAK